MTGLSWIVVSVGAVAVLAGLWLALRGCRHAHAVRELWVAPDGTRTWVMACPDCRRTPWPINPREKAPPVPVGTYDPAKPVAARARAEQAERLHKAIHVRRADASSAAPKLGETNVTPIRRGRG